MPEKVRARWVGGYNGIIPGVGPLNQGDEYLVYPHEVYGQTLLINPQNRADVTLVGYGHVAMAQHAGLSKAELEALGYVFEGASTNWEPLEPFDPAKHASAPQDLPTEADMSEYYHEPEPEASAPSEEPQPDLEARKNDDGSISLITRLPPPPEAAPAEDSSADS